MREKGKFLAPVLLRIKNPLSHDRRGQLLLFGLVADFSSFLSRRRATFAHDCNRAVGK